ncbi:hypothetical protein ACHAXS_002562 [Conticribra weissflogii]
MDSLAIISNDWEDKHPKDYFELAALSDMVAMSPRTEAALKTSSRSADDPTELFVHLQGKCWADALNRLYQQPEETRVWIFREDPSNELRKKLNKKRVLIWKLLPLHASIVLGAPPFLIIEILKVFPEAARKKDQRGSLPIHLAASRVDIDFDSERVVNCLKEVYYESTGIEDSSGHTPLELQFAAQERRKKIIEYRNQEREAWSSPPEEEGFELEFDSKDGRDALMKKYGYCKDYQSVSVELLTWNGSKSVDSHIPDDASIDPSCGSSRDVSTLSFTLSSGACTETISYDEGYELKSTPSSVRSKLTDTNSSNPSSIANKTSSMASVKTGTSSVDGSDKENSTGARSQCLTTISSSSDGSDKENSISTKSKSTPDGRPPLNPKSTATKSNRPLLGVITSTGSIKKSKSKDATPRNNGSKGGGVFSAISKSNSFGKIRSKSDVGKSPPSVINAPNRNDKSLFRKSQSLDSTTPENKRGNVFDSIRITLSNSSKSKSEAKGGQGLSSTPSDSLDYSVDEASFCSDQLSIDESTSNTSGLGSVESQAKSKSRLSTPTSHEVGDVGEIVISKPSGRDPPSSVNRGKANPPVDPTSSQHLLQTVVPQEVMLSQQGNESAAESPMSASSLLSRSIDGKFLSVSHDDDDMNATGSLNAPKMNEHILPTINEQSHLSPTKFSIPLDSPSRQGLKLGDILETIDLNFGKVRAKTAKPKPPVINETSVTDELLICLMEQALANTCQDASLLPNVLTELEKCDILTMDELLSMSDEEIISTFSSDELRKEIIRLLDETDFESLATIYEDDEESSRWSMRT